MPTSIVTARFPKEITKKLNEISDNNRVVKKFIVDSLEEYVNQHMFAEYLETEKSEIHDILIQRLEKMMEKKLWLLDQIIKDYIFVREGSKNDSR